MYFKSPSGSKGYTNSPEYMLELEKLGYVRLAEWELFAHIVLTTVKTWGIPAVVALGVYELTNEFLVGLIIFSFVQNILD